MKKAVKQAVSLGLLCSFSYLAVYIARNTLSAVSPSMIEKGVLNKQQIGNLSSIYFICYAAGQLINGIAGDRIKAKYMLTTGLMLGGISLLLFSNMTSSFFGYIAYGSVGFFLSMIYPPMAKTVSENIELTYVTRCSLGYTIASFFGSPFAGILAALIVWRWVFFTSSGILCFMAISCFVLFTVFEHKGTIKYNKYVRERGEGIIYSAKVLIRNKILKFSFIVILTGVVRTSVVFWMPTYFNEHLGYSSEKSAFIFTVSTLIICFSAFVSVFVFECLKRNLNLTMFIFFCFSGLLFLLMFIVENSVFNVVLLIGAVMCSNAADAMIWSYYCPSLRDTGLVSSATGFLDSLSYIGAALASKIFSTTVDNIGWNGLLIVWLCLMVTAIIISSFDMLRKKYICKQ